jgi:hypothetical protein
MSAEIYSSENEGQELERMVPRLKRMVRVGLVGGLLASAVLVVGYFLAGPEPFFRAYLIGYQYWLGLSLGCLSLAMLHYLVGGDWGLIVRRILEAGYKTTWLMGLLFLPLVLGLQYLYPWTDSEFMHSTLALEHKIPYLNPTAFILRAVLYFAIWIGLSVWLARWSVLPEYRRGQPRNRRFQRLGAAGLLLYGLTITFASIDWIMSLEPDWLSSIFGMLIASANALSAIALALAVLPLLVQYRPLTAVMTPRLFRDLGVILFSAVVFWAYLAYSQYLIIWWANIPREAVWYLHRFTGGWLVLALVILVVQFLLPFLLLLPLRSKQNMRLLAVLSIGILVTRLIDTFWHIAPSFHTTGLVIHWLYPVAPLAIGLLWAAAFAWHMQRTPQQVPRVRHEPAPPLAQEM